MRLRPQAQCSMFNKLYLPINGRAFWSQSVTLFQKEDVTWQDQKRWTSVSEELLQTVQLSFSFRPILSKKSSVGMRLCNRLNWNSISLAGFLLTRIIIIIVILCTGILQGNDCKKTGFSRFSASFIQRQFCFSNCCSCHRGVVQFSWCWGSYSNEVLRGVPIPGTILYP